MKTYYSLEDLVRDLKQLCNVSVNITKTVAYEANRLERREFRDLRKKLTDNKVKLILIKEEDLF